MTTYIGIDPGLQGGIAVISEEEEKDKIDVYVMPTLTKGKKKVYDHFALKDLLRILSYSLPYCILEEQHAMPKQGVVSMMSIGYGFGALKQCLMDFSIPHEVVRAQTWQKEFGISGRKGNIKAQALQICQGLFPDLNLLATERSKKPHEGIVDATLIAEFAKRRQGGEIR